MVRLAKSLITFLEKKVAYKQQGIHSNDCYTCFQNHENMAREIISAAPHREECFLKKCLRNYCDNWSLTI